MCQNFFISAKRYCYRLFNKSLNRLKKSFANINLRRYFVIPKPPFSFNADPRKKYHIKLLAYNSVGDGYQADQTISTPGCVCKFRDEIASE